MDSSALSEQNNGIVEYPPFMVEDRGAVGDVFSARNESSNVARETTLSVASGNLSEQNSEAKLFIVFPFNAQIDHYNRG